MALALTIGTCRVFEPTKHMWAAGCSARISLHRVHTPGEILNLLTAIKTDGRDLYNHLLADRAFDEAVLKGSNVVAEDRLRLREMWPRVDRLLIEVCSRRDFRAEDGKTVIGALVMNGMKEHPEAVERAIEAGRIAPLRADDFQKNMASRSELIADMWRISEEAEGRPITWVSHANPSDRSSEYDHVRNIRTLLAEDIEKGAKETGGQFFNPSQVVADIGQSNAFMEGGRDTAHFTDRAIAILAEEYARLLDLRAGVRRTMNSSN